MAQGTSGIQKAIYDLAAGGISSIERDDLINHLKRFGPGWRDNMTSFAGAKAPGANPAVWKEIGSSGVYWWHLENQAIEANEQMLSLIFHVDHDYDITTKIYPHVHFMPATAADAVVRFELSIYTAKRNDTTPLAFPMGSPTVVNLESSTFNTQWAHIVTETDDDDALAAGTVDVDSLILVNYRRKSSHANDTYTGDIIPLFGDMHYYADRYATPQKAPDFYTE